MDRWKNIDRPLRGNEINVRRFSAEARWEWFIGRDEKGRCLIVLILDDDPREATFPAIQGLDVRVFKDSQNKYRIVIALNDSEAFKPFRHICEDLVDVSEQVANPQGLPACVAERLETWKRLWRKQFSGTLTDEEQKGLVAELMFLREFWLDLLDDDSAIAGWVGPEPASQDFRDGFRAVEVKSRPPSKNSFIVSSVDQLWFDGELFVAVYPIAMVGKSDGTAMSLRILVDSVRHSLMSADSKERFEASLINCGYLDRQEYEEERFIVAHPTFYQVGEGFPKLLEDQVPAGIEGVRYSVSLNWCENFIVEKEEFKEKMNGSSGRVLS